MTQSLVECPLALILKEAELLTAATLGIDCLDHLLVLACPVVAGLDQSRSAMLQVSY